MVSGKKILCYICNKKCSGNVLRYQDRYYHKQCFESEQLNDSDDQSRINNINNNNNTINHLIARNNTNNLNSPNTYNKQTLDSATDLSSTSSAPYHQQLQNNRRTPTPINNNRFNNTNDNINNDSNSQQVSNVKQPKVFSSNNNANYTQHHSNQSVGKITTCAGCAQLIKDGQALIALDLHWHVWCFKCTKCQIPLHGEYVAKDGKAYCEKDYQKLFGVICVYCKRYITGKVLQAGESHHFHPSCARCSKCGDPFVPGEEMYLQGEVTWHPRCGPGPDSNGNPLEEIDFDVSTSRSHLQPTSAQVKSPSLSSRSRSRSASPISYMSRQYGRSSSPYGYTDSEAVGDLSRIYTISYLNADPAQGYLRKPVQPHPPKSPQFSRPASVTRESRSRSSSRSAFNMPRDRSVPRGMYSVLSGMQRGTSSYRARSPSMMNEEAIQLAHYPDAKKPSPGTVPKIERDDFPAPPFPYSERSRQSSSQFGAATDDSKSTNVATSSGDHQDKENHEEAHYNHSSNSQQRRPSRPRSREIPIDKYDQSFDDCSTSGDPQLKKEEEELSKIASGIGKIFLQTLKEREKIRAWKRSNLDPRNASRTPSATRELPQGLRYDNPTVASPSRDLDRARPWGEEDVYNHLLDNQIDHSPTRTRSSLGKPSQILSNNSSSSYGYKVVQSNRSTPRPGYGLSNGPYSSATLQPNTGLYNTNMNNINTDNSSIRKSGSSYIYQAVPHDVPRSTTESTLSKSAISGRSLNTSAIHLRRSMPNVNLQQPPSHLEPPKLYPYHLLITSNYRLPPDVDRCHLERHLSNEEFQYIFNCDRLDFYRLPEWRRNELKRRAKLF